MKVAAGGFFMVFHLLIIVLFAFCTEYDLPGTPADPSTNTTAITPAAEFVNYNMFQDVHVMIAIGFGFLMAFLYRNAFTTLGHSFMVMTFVAFWSMLNIGFWHRVVTGEHWDSKISIGISKLIEADFVSGAVLISFGALVGRASAEQLLVMAFFEVIFFAINESICVTQYMVADIGGSMIIHMFGAYFGLACSATLESGNKTRKEIYAKFSQYNSSSKTSDTFAMVGTLFLWCFWPSFNGALAGDMSSITVVNTYLAISASCLMSFYCVSFFSSKGKFRMVEIQNSTLAGGVAIGSCANMMIEPWAAILIGSIAGILSVFGYQKLSPRLPIVDTCGVHNLHGLPAIMAGIASIVVAGMATAEKYTFAVGITPDAVFARTKDEAFDSSKLALYQFATLLTTLAIALVGGAVTGLVLRVPALNLTRYYTDTSEWEVEDHQEEEQDLGTEYADAPKEEEEEDNSHQTEAENHKEEASEKKEAETPDSNAKKSSTPCNEPTA